MSICKDCIHADLCDRPILQMNAELDSRCKYYKSERNYYDLPAYVGLEVWLPWVYISKKENINIVHLDEGKVSGLQQKADGSWKIRISNKRRGSVSDYTVEEFNEKVFLIKEDAEKFIEKKIANYR